jgi:hypothetical protein
MILFVSYDTIGKTCVKIVAPSLNKKKPTTSNWLHQSRAITILIDKELVIADALRTPRAYCEVIHI